MFIIVYFIEEIESNKLLIFNNIHKDKVSPTRHRNRFVLCTSYFPNSNKVVQTE